MTYSCAYFAGGAQTLDEAQEAKLELVCRKLGLQAGERVLDVGCGWGSFAIHAARRHGVHVLGVTLSAPQAAARARAGRARPGSRTSWRSEWPTTARSARRAVRRDLEHRHGRARGGGADRSVRANARGAAAPPAAGCSTTGSPSCRTSRQRRGRRSRSGSCFPTESRCRCRGSLRALERTGLVTTHVEGLQDDYARTTSVWIARFEERYDGGGAARGRASARGSGVCTCAPPIRGLRPAGRRSTRCSRTSPERPRVLRAVERELCSSRRATHLAGNKLPDQRA